MSNDGQPCFQSNHSWGNENKEHKHFIWKHTALVKNSNTIIIETKRGLLLAFREHRPMGNAAFSIQMVCGSGLSLNNMVSELSISKCRELRNSVISDQLVHPKPQAFRHPHLKSPQASQHLSKEGLPSVSLHLRQTSDKKILPTALEMGRVMCTTLMNDNGLFNEIIDYKTNLHCHLPEVVFL